MASKGSPSSSSSSSDNSEKNALLATPETSESSDDGTYTEARMDFTTTSYETASEAESGQSGSNLPKDRSGLSDAPGKLPKLTSGSVATGRDESEECGAAAENVLSASTDQTRDRLNSRNPNETRAAEIKSLLARGNAGPPAEETTPLRFDLRSTRPYSMPHPRLVNPNERTGGVLGCLTNFLKCWQAYSIYISDSIFLLPLQVLLIAASISAVVVGSLYVHDCPMATELPFMIIALGSLGCLAETLRVVLVVYFYRSHILKLLGKMRACIIIVNLLFVIAYAVEMWTFFSYTTSFDAGDYAYCNPVFHTYTSILNCSLFLVLLILFILHFPAFLSNHFNVGGAVYPIEESQ